MLSKKSKESKNKFYKTNTQFDEKWT